MPSRDATPSSAMRLGDHLATWTIVAALFVILLLA